MAQDNVFPFERRVAPPQQHGFEHGFDAPGALARCRAMLEAIAGYGTPEAVAEACVTTLLINLHDLLQRARALGRPLAFADHIDPADGIRDIGELVAVCRNAACHVWGRRGSDCRVLPFHRIAGYCPRAFTVEGRAYGCSYHDDVALYYGPHRLYLKRHAARAVEELSALLGPAPDPVAR